MPSVNSNPAASFHRRHQPTPKGSTPEMAAAAAVQRWWRRFRRITPASMDSRRLSFTAVAAFAAAALVFLYSLTAPSPLDLRVLIPPAAAYGPSQAAPGQKSPLTLDPAASNSGSDSKFEDPVSAWPPLESFVGGNSTSDGADEEESSEAGAGVKVDTEGYDPEKSSQGGAGTLLNSTSESADEKESEVTVELPPQMEREKPSISTMTPDQELAFAKKEIMSAPLVSDDPELYAPLFRNVSTFKRSYDMMEKILKVYIYKDGKRPIFHTPPIKGIYASEGWFMKLMERNKQFMVKRPKQAHLFYLPYSAHQLELALYVPESNNMQQLSLFLKNYVNTIAAKYPFWNRTHGSDHFLVACHDWGPYTTREHDELLKNAIKALCNADISEGIFIRGRDVSLPETAIKTPRRPLRDLGGNPISQRTILAFYAGHMHGRVRPTLLKYWTDKDEDMRIYGPLPNSIARKMSYAKHMKSSKFCICPMGYEVNSPRIVESIYYECVPVIIADNFVPPFDEVLDWSSFSVTVAEKDIPNLKDILLQISPEQYSSMHRSVQKVQKHFLWHASPVKYDLFHMILHSIWFSRLNHVQTEQ